MPALLASSEGRRRADLEFRVEKLQHRASDKACTQLEGKKEPQNIPIPLQSSGSRRGAIVGWLGDRISLSLTIFSCLSS